MNIFEERVGTIEHYYPHAHAAVVRLDRGALTIGDTVHIVGHGTDLVERVTSLEKDHEPIQEARPGDSVGLWVPDKVHEKAEVYRVPPPTTE